MNTTDRRMEIINILVVRRHTTARELAEEFGVTTRTIRNDIQALSPEFPIVKDTTSDMTNPRLYRTAKEIKA